MWSQDWGTMIWSGGAAVPMLHPLAVLLLSGLLIGLGGLLARHPHGLRWAGMGLALLVLPIALPAIALGPLPFTFQNGTVADALEVNQNLEVLRGAVTAVEALQVVYVASQSGTTNIEGDASNVMITSFDLPVGAYLIQLTASARAQGGGFCQLTLAGFPAQQLAFQAIGSSLSPNFVPQQEISARSSLAMQAVVELASPNTVELTCSGYGTPTYSSHPLSISSATLIGRPVAEIVQAP